MAKRECSEEIWENIKEAVKKIYSGLKEVSLLVKLHSNINKFSYFVGESPAKCVKRESFFGDRPCIQNQMLVLLDKLKILLEDLLQELLTKSNDLSGEKLLIFYIKEWELFKNASNSLTGAFPRMYKEDLSSLDINILISNAWYMIIFSKLCQRMNDTIHKIINDDREGKIVNFDVLDGIISCYISIDGMERSEMGVKIYEDFFENIFIENTKKFIANELNKIPLIEDESLVKFLLKIDTVLKSDKTRTQRYVIKTSTIDKVEKVHQDFFYSIFCKNTITHSNWFLDFFRDTEYNYKLQKLIYSFDYRDIRKIYLLCENYSDSMVKLEESFEFCLYTEVKKSLKGKTNEMFSRTACELIERWENLVSNSFDKNLIFQNILERIFKQVLNVEYADSFKFLPEYINFLINNIYTFKTGSDIMIIKLLKVLRSLKYITCNDSFKYAYRKLLTKRIIYSTELISPNLEESIITKLNDSCGNDYTVLLRRMIDSFREARDINVKHHKNQLYEGSKFNFLVFPNWVYNLKDTFTFNLPSELREPVQKFNNFYKDTIKENRKLNWIHSASHGQMTTNCFGNIYTLKVNALQIAILLQFNKETSLTIRELCENIGLGDYQDLISSLQIILKLKILKSDCSDFNNLNNDSIIKICFEFQDDESIINLHVPITTGIKKNKDTENSCYNIMDREYFLKACIIRVLKSEKILNLDDLFKEVSLKLRNKFNFVPNDVKKCANNLIEQEYLELSDNVFYKYLP